MALAIRLAEAGDLPAIQAMLEALAEATGHAGEIRGSEDDLLRYGFGTEPRFTVWLASVDGEDAGMLLGFPDYSSWRGRPGLYVQDLYVAAHYRGAGVARALLARASEGAAYLRLSVASDNSAAVDFYLRAGFAESRAERIFVIEGDALDALCQAAT